MKACIITTTKTAETNLGDKLIADRCGAMAMDLSTNVSIENVYHGHPWDQVAEKITSADFVLIACLAIRNGIFTKNYRFGKELIQSKVPICVVASGISLGVFTSSRALSNLIPPDEIRLLRALSDRSLFFSSRGYLSQSVLADMKVRSTFAGDVAFYEPRFSHRKFVPVNKVKRIAVSDPHYAPAYKNSFLHLIKKLRSLFPKARIDLLLHGYNEDMIPIAEEAGVKLIELYKEYGLDHYDTYDMHVGYRVHGHVSALVRRKPSYLIEQDDRGIDYGSSFSRRISVSSYSNMKRDDQVLVAPIDALGGIIREDAAQGFSRFFGLETELEACAMRNFNGVKNALVGAGIISGSRGWGADFWQSMKARLAS